MGEMKLAGVFLLVTFAATPGRAANDSPCLRNSGDTVVGVNKSLSVDNSAALDSAVRVFLRRYDVPGASVTIARKNVVQWERSYGFADLENHTAANSATLFRLASVSKTITSVAVLQLVEEGRLQLDAPIQTYVPEFPNKRYPVTVRSLLAATSGIRGYRGSEYLSSKPYASLLASLSIFAADSLLYEPGTAYTETPYGFTLLGLAVERASGLSFSDYLRRRVFATARMQTAQPDFPAANVRGRTRFYSRDATGTIHNAAYVDASYKIPAGGLIASARDLVAFGACFLSGRLISTANVRLMSSAIRLHDGQELPLGWGLALGDLGGRYRIRRDAIWTAGLQQGATDVLYMLPQEDLVIAILTNLDSGPSLLTDLVNLSDSLATLVLKTSTR